MEDHADEVIHELISIENQCAEVTKAIKDEAEGFGRRIEAERERINAAMDERISQELSIIRDASIEETRARMITASANSQKLFAAMETAFEERGEEWAESIFTDITGKRRTLAV
jgi:hypothetical protein